MLSKVLSGRDTDRAQPLMFSAVSHCQVEPPPERDPSENAALDRENHTLCERVRQLEAELVITKRDAFEAGRRQGDQQARAETAPILERLGASLSEITGMRHELRLSAEKDMVQLALLIAKRILHRELSVDVNALTALARVVCDRLVRAESWKVTVHPRFAAAIAAAISSAQSTRVQIEPDPNCALGTLLVRSEEGRVDASVDAQLDEISRGLADRLAGHSS